jgi:hypothetical protein
MTSGMISSRLAKTLKGSLFLTRLPTIFYFLFTLLNTSFATADDQGFVNIDPVLDERCIINVLNGSARVDKYGNFALLTPLPEDVPYRARAICEQDNVLFYGESALLYGVPDDATEVGEIFFDRYNPVPVALNLSVATKLLSIDSPIVQIHVEGLLPDGSSKALTHVESGTIYNTSSPKVLTVSDNGLVTAVNSGRAIVTVRHEGSMSAVEFDVFFPVDSDSDGIPDDFEILNALDPNDPNDAFSDKDNDGLTNLEEYLLGTSILHADTDGDTISDFDELQFGTDPSLPDTDGDGLIDGEEIIRGTDPLDSDSDNDGINDSLEVQFGLDPLSFTQTTILSGHVFDVSGQSIAGANVVAFNVFSAATNQDGSYNIEGVPVVNGDVVVTARLIKGGLIYDGESSPVAANPDGLTNIDDITINPIIGELIGTVRGPRGNSIVGARVIATFITGEERSVNTDFQGMYQLSNLPAGDVTVVAQDPRTGLYGVSKGIVSHDSNLSLDIGLSALGTIKGFAFEHDGITVVNEKTLVTITRVGGGYSKTTEVNAFGEYQFEFVPLGEYIIESFGEGNNRGQTRIVLSGTNQILDANIIFLGTGRIAGYVENATGERIGNTTIKLISNNIFGNTAASVTTDNLGEFNFEQVYLGKFSLDAENSQRDLSGVSEGNVEYHNIDIDIVLTMDIQSQSTASVAGFLYTYEGYPEPGATIEIRNKKVITDELGAYLIEHVRIDSGFFNNVITAKTSTGDYASVVVELPQAGVVVDKDITLTGQGVVKVIVNSLKGEPVGGVQVTLKSGPSSLVLISNSLGEVNFNHVNAGAITIKVFDPIDRLGGSISTSVNAGESIVVPVNLEAAADIIGTVYLDDGVTPAVNMEVSLKDNWKYDAYQIKTGSDGRYQLSMLPLAKGPYRLQVKDSYGVVRATSEEISLSLDGEQIVQNLTLLGNGQVEGFVSYPGGGIAAGVVVTLDSRVSGSDKRTSRTDSSGHYQFNNVPVGNFDVESVHILNRFGVVESGEVIFSGELVVLNVEMKENQLPSSVSTVASYYDANGFSYSIQRDGTIRDGTSSVFLGDSDIYRGAARLDIFEGDKIYPFIGGSIGYGNDSRETIINKITGSIAVTRKIFVPENGYFSRYIESFNNPSDQEITITARIDSHYRISQSSRIIDGVQQRFLAPMGIVSSSSLDTFLNVTAGIPDRWVVLDDFSDEDPFITSNLPALSHLFDGIGGQVSASSAEYLSGFTGFNRMRVAWTITIPANETRSIMHFVSQQTSRESAFSSVQRLDLLPPESLEGLSSEEISQIINFSLPSDGSSAVPELPELLNTVEGSVFEFDSVAIENAEVIFNSDSSLFNRTYKSITDENGHFNFTGRSQGKDSIAIPAGSFSMRATHPQSGADVDQQFTNSNGMSNLVFDSTGTISGSVRRFDGVVASFGKVELIGEKLADTLTAAIPEDGQYKFTGLPAGQYQLIATFPVPDGSDIAGTSSANLEAQQHLIRDITLVKVGGVTGQIVTADGEPVTGLRVTISAEGFVRYTNTDSGGFYKFLDMPLGNYSIQINDPNVGVSLTDQVIVSDDSLVNVDMRLIVSGKAFVKATYEDGSPVSGGDVKLEYESGKKLLFSLNDKGEKLISNIPVGSYEITVINPHNYNLLDTYSGSITTHNELVAVQVTIPADNPPSGSISNPIENSEFMKGERIVVEAIATDDYGIHYVDFIFNEKLIYRDFSAPYLSNITLDIGDRFENNYLSITVVDIAKNTVYDKVLINVTEDTEVPIISEITPAADFSIIEGQVLNYSAAVVDNVGIKRVEFFINDELILTDNDFPYSGEYLLDENMAENFETVSLSVHAYDYAENKGVVSRVIKVAADEHPIVNLSTYPEDGQQYIEGTEIFISGNASDDIGVTKVELIAGGDVVLTRFNAPYTFNYSAPLLDSINNPVSLILRAYDTLNQTSDTEVINVVIEKNELPEIQFLTPIVGAEFTEGQLIEISVNASDDVELDRVEFYVSDELVDTVTVPPFSTNYRLLNNIEAEQIEFKAIAVDSIEQIQEISRVIISHDDQIPPTVSIIAPQDGALISIGESDVAIVIDTSGSTSSSSGSDLDGDGTIDNILKAEIYSAKQLLNFLNPSTTQVSIIDFSSSAVLVQSLTNDFELANQKLDQILASGPGGGTNFQSAMAVATNELVGSRARHQATPVQLFMSDGSASIPTSEILRAAEAGIIVNSFAVGSGANISALEAISEGTGGVATAIPDASLIVEILPRTILFGIDALISIADANDDIAVKEVLIKLNASNGEFNGEHVDYIAPYSSALSLPTIKETVDISITAIAKDYGDNSLESDTISVTLLPAENTPNLIRLEPEYAMQNALISIKGQFLIPTGSSQPSSDDPSLPATNIVIFNEQEIAVEYSDKSVIKFSLPEDSISGSIVVMVDGIETNALMLYIDDDQDGLSNEQEIEFGTDPSSRDSDGDGLSDGEEINIYLTNPLLEDSDADGLTDFIEVNNQLDPNDNSDAEQDADNDGLTNAEEISLGTLLDDSDTDNDGLTDGEEVDLGTQPKDSDSDNDYLSDGDEVNVHGTNPLNNDSDGDTIADNVEINNGLDAMNAADATEDMDSDGLTNVEEISLTTNVNNADTDSDGLSDFDEVNTYATSPTRSDTDYDGENDGFEIANSTDPLDANSSTTVSFSHTLFDSENHEWSVDKYGQVRGGNYVITYGFELKINNQEFRDTDYRAVRDGQQQIVLESTQFNNLQVVRKVFVSPDQPIIRYMDIVKNISNTKADVNFKLSSDFNRYSYAAVVMSSTQDEIVDNADTYAIVDGGNGNVTSSHLWGNAESTVRPTVASYVNNDLVLEYQVSVEAGETSIFMHFESLSANQSIAQQNIQAYELLPDYMLEKITLDEFDSIKNFMFDTDGDGLSDKREELLGTDINNPDTDNDGLNDAFEVIFNLDPLVADDSSSDNDGDGLTLLQEQEAGTNPEKPDSDEDGLLDGEEQAYQTDPLNIDTDADGLSDGDEVNIHGSDPVLLDSDGDTLNDGIEVNSYGTNPALADTDGDEINDNVEIDNNLDPLDAADGNADPDADGLLTKEELLIGTSFTNPDSDYDGLTDGDEVSRATNPLDDDTDNDGESDGMEVDAGTDPLDSSSTSTLAFPIDFIDGSGSVWNIQQGGFVGPPITSESLDQKFILSTDSDPYYRSESRAKKISAGTIEIIGRNDFEIPLPLQINREINVPNNQPFIRYLEKFTNITNETIDIKVYISDSFEQVSELEELITSSGDSILSLDDNYFVTAPSFMTGLSFGHLWGSSISDIRISDISSTEEGRGIYFDLKIHANQTVSLLHFGTQAESQAEVITLLKEFELFPSYLFDGLSVEQMESIINISLDEDNDGLSDGRENLLGTDPKQPDTDGDGLFDGFEYKFGFDPLVPGEELLDTDADNLTNLQEHEFGSNPLVSDTDEDGLSDDIEFALSTNPNSADSDDDGLTDIFERDTSLTNPTKADTDDDGLMDGAELNVTNTNPLIADTDSDGISDGAEVEASLDPKDASDAVLDNDSDGLTNLEEFNAGTDIQNPDTDTDGLLDGLEVNSYLTDPNSKDTDSDGLFDNFEVKYGFNPLISGEEGLDLDGDNLTSLEEQNKKTDPNLADTDSDGVNDDLDGAPNDPTRTERPGVLLVNDSLNEESLAAYVEALDFLAVDYSIANAIFGDLPSRENMADKALVIWMNGEFGFLDTQEDILLSSYLNGGGCSILSSQDHHFVQKMTSILDVYMGLSSINDDAVGEISSMSIVGYGDLYPVEKNYSLLFDFENYSDELILDDSTEVMFKTNQNIIGSRFDSGQHVGVFLGFPLEAVSQVDQRADIIKRIYDDCSYTHDINVDYQAPISDGDGESPFSPIPF